ncbi:hypothetical protein AB0A77_37785 [Streptomyces varsoviensis]|uniref:hypothetical protein n=1 Tax=Streptomyces varsoviensis TaxID=67373 RepID=UPI0033E9DA41
MFCQERAQELRGDERFGVAAARSDEPVDAGRIGVERAVEHDVAALPKGDGARHRPPIGGSGRSQEVDAGFGAAGVAQDWAGALACGVLELSSNGTSKGAVDNDGVPPLPCGHSVDHAIERQPRRTDAEG